MPRRCVLLCVLHRACGLCGAAERGKTRRGVERRERGAAPLPRGSRCGCLRAAAVAAACFARVGSPAGSTACLTSCRFQGGQQQPGPVPCGLSPGKGRAASAHRSFVRSRAGMRGKQWSFGIPLGRIGLE